MNQQPDPLELLKVARPSESRVDLSTDPIARAILQRTLDDRSPARVARRAGHRARRAVIVGVVGVVAVAGTAAAITFRHDKPSEIRTIGCWSDAVVPASEIVVVEWSGGDPVRSCQQAWRDGAFETIPATEPPPLIACISIDGAIAVIPGNEATCDELELASFDPAPDPEGEKVRAAITAIETRVSQKACLEPTAAISVIEEILDNAGLSDWTIVPPTDTFPEAEPCASVGFDVPTMTVYIVPLARVSGG
jgi:hypothetical protein